MRPLVFCAALLGTPAQAGIVSDVWGTFTDPLKLEASTENGITAVREARSAALAVVSSMSELQARNHANIQEYLQDIDLKISRISELGDNFISQVADLEAKIVADVAQLLSSVECSAQRIGQNAVYDQIMVKLPDVLIDKEIVYTMPFGTQQSYVFFGLVPWGEEQATFVYNTKGANSDPYDLFTKVEAAYLESLNNAPPDGKAALFPATYANLANLAARTACEYSGTQFEKLFIAKKFAEYNALIVPWGHAISVDH